MPEQTSVQFAWDLLGKPVLIFFMGLLGWNIKRAHGKIDSFPKDYVAKENYRSDMKELKEFMKEDRKVAGEDRKVYREGMERVHARIDDLVKK